MASAPATDPHDSLSEARSAEPLIDVPLPAPDSMHARAGHAQAHGGGSAGDAAGEAPGIDEGDEEEGDAHCICLGCGQQGGGGWSALPVEEQPTAAKRPSR